MCRRRETPATLRAEFRPATDRQRRGRQCPADMHDRRRGGAQTVRPVRCLYHQLTARTRQAAGRREYRPAFVSAWPNTDFQSARHSSDITKKCKGRVRKRICGSRLRLRSLLHQPTPACPSHGAFPRGQTPPTVPRREVQEAENRSRSVQPHLTDSDCWSISKRTRDCVECSWRVVAVAAEKIATMPHLNQSEEHTS